MTSLTEPGTALYQFLVWLQASPLGEAMRHSGVWSYGVVNLVHNLGVASLFGAVLILDLRLLGVWKKVSVAALGEVTSPIALTGFLVAVVAGVCMICTNATDYAGNPFLLIKFPAILAGFANAVILNRQTAWRQRRTRDFSPVERRRLAWLGGVSLACWLTAISAGRMIGYW